MADAPLSVVSVTAGYRGRAVIADIDLEVAAGEVLGLVGPNGAGKSTLVKAVTGQIPLTSGRVLVFGIDLSRHPERAKAGLGFAVGAADLPGGLSGRQYLELVATIRGVALGDRDAAALGRLGADAWLDAPLDEVSLGTRAKLSIVAALVGAPPLVILDESLNGLDPVAAFEAKRMIRDLAREGRAIIVATHVVETIPSLCDRAALLVAGRIAKVWSKADLAARSAAGAFEADVMGAFKDLAPA